MMMRAYGVVSKAQLKTPGVQQKTGLLGQEKKHLNFYLFLFYFNHFTFLILYVFVTCIYTFHNKKSLKNTVLKGMK